MKSVLEQLYYGEFSPYSTQPASRRYKAAWRDYMTQSAALSARLRAISPELERALDQLEGDTMYAIEREEMFRQGVRLAAQLLLEL